MRTITLIALGAGSLALAGCGAGEVEDAAPPPGPTAGAAQPGAATGERAEAEPVMEPPGDAVVAHAEGCPMQVPGVHLDTEDIEGGAALVFTTTEPAHVAELRSLVRAMAPMSEQEPASTEDLLLEPPAALRVVDIPDGARLEMLAEDPSDVAALRRQARLRADLMIRGACPLVPPQVAALSSPARRLRR